MSEETYRAMRAYIDLAVELRVEKKLAEIRSASEIKTPEPVVGPAGKDGRDGVDGKPAIDGKDGRDGNDGKLGERGADGSNGKDGADGAPSTTPGPKGDKGDNGERGADGIATREEIEGVVKQRVADMQVRTFADVYQGVYKPDEFYTRGVLTTWGGSLFLAKADTKDKPGESANWQLVVKRGADGKDVGNRR